MYSLEEMSDRLEIPTVLTRYASGLDIPGRAFTHWDDAFTDDAEFVNWNGPGSVLSRPEMERFLTVDDPVHSHQHLLSNVVVTQLGPSDANTRAEYVHVGLHRTDSPTKARLISKGGFYETNFVRTSCGWRIRRHAITRRWDKYELVDWPAADSTWGNTVMAPSAASDS